MEELAHLTKLTSLDLSKNGLGGSLSADIQQLSALKSLTLANNHITGSIPFELTALTLLDAILLQRNRFTGLLPPLSFSKFTAACGVQSYSQPEPAFMCPLPSGAGTCHTGADAGVPTCGNHTFPTTTAPPAPTPATTAAPTPAWAHRCAPGNCNVCEACCRDFVGAGLPCEQCFQEECEGTPAPAPAPTPAGDDVNLNLITALGVSFSAAVGLGLVVACACACARRCCKKQEAPLEKPLLQEAEEPLAVGRGDFATAPLIDPEEQCTEMQRVQRDTLLLG
jgi:hypothetical protein